jgi:polyisoprenoid-binding protein YceI
VASEVREDCAAKARVWVRRRSSVEKQAREQSAATQARGRTNRGAGSRVSPSGGGRRAAVGAGLFVAALVSSVTLAAAAALTKAGTADITFRAVGPAGLKIDGKTSDFEARDDGTNVVFAVPLANMTTGIALRDKHMREKYLEVQKYPKAELTVARSAIKFPADGGEVRGEAPGTMSIHGVTRPTTVAYTARRRGDTYDVSGTTRINIKDYKIDVPSYLGVTVKPDVDVAVRFQVADR